MKTLSKKLLLQIIVAAMVKDFTIEPLTEIVGYEGRYRMICFDGFAIGNKEIEGHTLAEGDVIEMTYPLLNTLTESNKDEIRAYRGLDATESIVYGDVMIKYGNAPLFQ